MCWQFDEMKAAKEEQIASLQSKLDWYFENQTLIGKLQEQMKEDAATITQLKDKVGPQLALPLRRSLGNDPDDGGAAVQVAALEDADASTTFTAGRTARGTRERKQPLSAKERHREAQEAAAKEEARAKVVREQQLRIKDLEKALAKKHPNAAVDVLRALKPLPGAEEAEQIAVLRARNKDLSEQIEAKDQEMDRELRALRQVRIAVSVCRQLGQSLIRCPFHRSTSRSSTCLTSASRSSKVGLVRPLQCRLPVSCSTRG
jgi:hypothetical protein